LLLEITNYNLKKINLKQNSNNVYLVLAIELGGVNTTSNLYLRGRQHNVAAAAVCYPIQRTVKKSGRKQPTPNPGIIPEFA
jgi:hypothetical protein